MRYSCLMVDDEEDVSSAIINKLDWNGMGYEQPRYAHNLIPSLLQQSNCGILSFLHDAAFSPVTYAYFITVEYIANAVAALIAH